jgi:hypothetical protein
MKYAGQGCLVYELISEKDIRRIDAAAMEVLEKTELLVEKSSILDLLENVGAKIDRKRRVTGDKHAIGGDNLVISSGTGAIWILDLDTTHESSVSEHLLPDEPGTP